MLDIRVAIYECRAMPFWDRWRRKPDVVDLVRRAVSEIDPAAARRTFDDAVAHASAGRTDAATAALATLGERERLLATVVVGLVHPVTAAALARVVEGPEVKWNGREWSELLGAWLVRVVDDLGVTRASRLIAGGWYGARGTALVSLVRDRIARGRLDDARAAHAAIDPMAKRERAVARAAIGLASHVPSELEAAIDDALCAPLIEERGEEAEALAAVLGEIARAEADVELADRIVEQLHRLALVPTEKGHAQWGAFEAAIACLRAAGRDPRWRTRAERLRDAVASSKLSADLDVAFAGSLPAEPAREEPPSLDEIRAEADAERRIDRACARAAWAFSAGDPASAVEAVRATLDPRDETAATIDDRIDWARALAAGGRRDEAARLIQAAAASGECLAARAFTPALEVLDPESARRFVIDQLAVGAATVDLRQSSHGPHQPAAELLGKLVVRTGDAVLQAQLLAAVETIGHFEDPVAHPHSENARWRLARIEACRRALGLATAPPRADEVEEVDGPESEDLTGGLSHHATKRRWRTARAHLERREWDAAIAIAVAFPDCRYTGLGPGDLVTTIVAALDMGDAWTAARASELAGALAGDEIHAQDTLLPTFQLYTSVARRGLVMVRRLEPLVGRIRDKFRLGDPAAVDAIWAAALATAGEVERAAAMLRDALAEISRAGKLLHTRASLLVACTRALPANRRAALWRAACATLPLLDDHLWESEAKRVAANLVDDELPWLAEFVSDTTLPERVRAALGDEFLEYVAERSVAGVELAAAHIATLRDPAAALRAARAIARHLARNARWDEATVVAELAGLG